MRFRLITLLGLVTIICCVMAVGVSVINHRIKVRQHRHAFQRIDEKVSSLDVPMRDYILQMPGIATQLERANAIDPAMALSHSINGESFAFGTYEFSRTFHYDWQLPDGSRSEGIKIRINSLLQEETFDRHVLTVSFQPSPHNDEVVAWIGQQFALDSGVEIRHVQTTHQSLDSSQMSADGEADSLESGAVYFGIR